MTAAIRGPRVSRRPEAVGDRVPGHLPAHHALFRRSMSRLRRITRRHRQEWYRARSDVKGERPGSAPSEQPRQVHGQASAEHAGFEERAGVQDPTGHEAPLEQIKQAHSAHRAHRTHHCASPRPSAASADARRPTHRARAYGSCFSRSSRFSASRKPFIL